MPFRYRAKTLFSGIVAADTDTVIAWCPVPREGTLLRSGIEISVIGGETVLSLASMWGMSGKLVPVIDPSTADTLNDIWDLMVSKAKTLLTTAGAITFDLDTAQEDTNPETQLAEAHWEEMMGVQLDASEFMQYRSLLTFAKSPTGFRAVDAAEDQYVPTEFRRSTSKTRLTAERPSYALIGFSSPSTTRTQTAISSFSAQSKWMQTQYMEDTVVDAMKQLVGLTEAGATRPFSDAAQLIQEIVSPPALELVAGDFVNQAWQVIASAFFDVEVPGIMQARTIGNE